MRWHKRNVGSQEPWAERREQRWAKRKAPGWRIGEPMGVYRRKGLAFRPGLLAEEDVHWDDFASLAGVGAFQGDAFAACASELLCAFFLCTFSHGGMPFEEVGTGESIAKSDLKEQSHSQQWVIFPQGTSGRIPLFHSCTLCTELDRSLPKSAH